MEPDADHETPPEVVHSSITVDLIETDDRLLALERHMIETRRALVTTQDALLDQMITTGVLEVLFALFLAISVWVQYRNALREVV